MHAAAETFTVAPRSVADEKAVFATVESISVVPARGRIGGTVVQLNVREGDRVTRGQAIATIGDEKLALQMKSLDAQIDALQAQSNQAQIDFTRIEGLVERGTLPRSSSTRRGPRSTSPRTGCARRTAERAVVQQQLNEGQVLAPAGGRVLKKLVAVGSVVLPGDAVAMIAQQNFKLRLRVPERHARFLKAGDKIRIDGAEFGDRGAQIGRDRSGLSADRGRPRHRRCHGRRPRRIFRRRAAPGLDLRRRRGPRFVIPSSYVTTRFGIDYVRVRQGDRTIDVPVQRGRELPTPGLARRHLKSCPAFSAGDQLVRP